MNALIRQGLDSGALRFDTTTETTDADLVLLCLPTPANMDGSADLSAIEQTVKAIRDRLRRGAVVVTKSTVPVGTSSKLDAALGRPDVAVVSNPEFLREGHAVYDFLHPTRILIGADDPAAAKKVATLYDAICAEIVITDPATAELAKYAANGFLATKLSYVNTLTELCETFGADITDLTYILGADSRIGAEYLRSGPGWGGPCLPKDARALLHQARHAGTDFPILAAAIDSNARQHDRVMACLRAELSGRLAGARIGVLGLTFKAGTNDLRDSPATRIAQALIDHGAIVTAHDPTVDRDILGLIVAPDAHDVATDANALVLLTDWPDYRTLDWTRIRFAMTGDLVLDTRNALDAGRLADAGLRYIGTGRGRRPAN
jgi:UDPglucose 6-dehydrogenase